MLKIDSRIQVAAPARAGEVKDQLALPFTERQKSRLRARLASGEEVALTLPRGEVLRGGDLLRASDGRVVEVVARPEKLLHVECDSPQALARASYHLGNRHVPVQVGRDFLRLAADHVLERMLNQLGARTIVLEAPFEPEAGAYGGHAHESSAGHAHAEHFHGGRIHEFGGSAERPAGDDDDDHSHDRREQ